MSIINLSSADCLIVWPESVFGTITQHGMPGLQLAAFQLMTADNCGMVDAWEQYPHRGPGCRSELRSRVALSCWRRCDTEKDKACHDAHVQQRIRHCFAVSAGWRLARRHIRFCRIWRDHCLKFCSPMNFLWLQVTRPTAADEEIFLKGTVWTAIIAGHLWPLGAIIRIRCIWSTLLQGSTTSVMRCCMVLAGCPAGLSCGETTQHSFSIWSCLHLFGSI